MELTCVDTTRCVHCRQELGKGGQVTLFLHCVERPDDAGLRLCGLGERADTVLATWVCTDCYRSWRDGGRWHLLDLSEAVDPSDRETLERCLEGAMAFDRMDAMLTAIRETTPAAH